jgi:hypothetical protein
MNEFFAFRAGEAEHHPLIARAFMLAVLLLLGVDPHCDIGRLAVQQDLDLGAVKGESLLIVADVLHDIARDLRDQLAIDDRLAAELVEQRRLSAALAGNHDLVGGGERLAAEPGIDLAVVGDAEFDVVLQKGIEHGIRNLVADLVGMSLGNGFAGKQIIRA